MDFLEDTLRRSSSAPRQYARMVRLTSGSWATSSGGLLSLSFGISPMGYPFIACAALR